MPPSNSASPSDSQKVADGLPGSLVAIERVTDETLPVAVERLIGARGPSARDQADRFLAFAREQQLDLTWFWTQAGPRRPIERAILVVPNPGRTAILFASPAGHDHAAPPLGAMIDAACDQVDPARVRLIQALVDPGDQPQMAALAAGGLSELARLCYLERTVPRSTPEAGPWPENVELVSCGDVPPGTLDDEISGVLTASYIDTLDCPGLRGLRAPEDVLAGHRATGLHEPALWTLMRVDGVARGVILLNPAPASNAVELVYLGLDPAVRGRGLARKLLGHGLGLLVGRKERTVTLAVDLRNDPARAIYRDAGFVAVLRRTAFIRQVERISP